MSTTVIEEALTVGKDYDSRLFSVSSSNQESLADYVRRVRSEKNLSTPDVERQSGGRITDAYVSRIENGYVKNVSPEKLQALAKGLGVPEDEIFAVARGKSVSGDLQLNELRLVEYFRTLTTESQEVLLAYAEMMSLRTSATGRRVPGVAKGASVLQEKEKKRA
jgi:transcriptional regulator with XRE-family HTH domain